MLENTSSASSEKSLESVGYAAALYNAMNGRHPWLARCQDETRDSANTTLKRAHYRHTTVTEALMIKEESACKHPRNWLECTFNPPKPWPWEVTASPAELSWQREHSALIADGKAN